MITIMRCTVAAVAAAAAMAGCSAEAGAPGENVGDMSEALVTFDAATGTGFVGKGDVQAAFGWNNAALQANAACISFSFVATETYEAVCTFITGEGKKGEKIHNVAHKRTSQVNAVVEHHPRVRNQITGFMLTGLGECSEPGGDAPVLGGPCPGNAGHDGTWTAVTMVDSTGGLFVTHDGNAVLLQ